MSEGITTLEQKVSGFKDYKAVSSPNLPSPYSQHRQERGGNKALSVSSTQFTSAFQLPLLWQERHVHFAGQQRARVSGEKQRTVARIPFLLHWGECYSQAFLSLSSSPCMVKE